MANAPLTQAVQAVYTLRWSEEMMALFYWKKHQAAVRGSSTKLHQKGTASRVVQCDANSTSSKEGKRTNCTYRTGIISRILSQDDIYLAVFQKLLPSQEADLLTLC